MVVKKSARGRGLARSTRVSTGQARVIHQSGSSISRTNAMKTTIIINQTNRQLEHDRSQRRLEDASRGLGPTTLQALNNLRGDIHLGEGREFVPPVEADWVDDYGIDIRGLAGNDDVSAFLHDIRDAVQARPSRPRSHCDSRSWRQRATRRQQNWAPQLPGMTIAYLVYNSKRQPGSPTSPASGNSPISESPLDTPVDRPDSVMIPAIDIYTLQCNVSVPRSNQSVFFSEDLVSHGYIGNSPSSPSIAISIRTLELYRRLRNRQTSFSIHAFSQVLADLYQRPFERHSRVAFSDAFDSYLDILRRVDGQLQAAMGRDTPNWRVLNACPACTFVLEDEPPMVFSRMFALDGNNSLKRMAIKNASDPRVFTESDYYLPNEHVESFAHEVPSSDEPLAPASEEATGDPSANLPPLAGPSDDPRLPSVPCTAKFKAAAQDGSKRMWGTFEETGIFASACRHGFILWVTDMVRSGELSKYPLSIVAKGLKVLGKSNLWGYDIACSFSKTVSSSSLGPSFAESDSRFCVPSFHASAHNYNCQKDFHPKDIIGVGLEDLESMERIFSRSNHLASLTRHSSAFHRRQYIDLHFRQWDTEKYANLATMLHNNYTQALKIIEEDGPALEEALTGLGKTRDDLDRYAEEEKTYIAGLQQEPQWDVHAVAYVRSLQKYQAMKVRSERSDIHFFDTVPDDYVYGGRKALYNSDASQTQILETERRVCREQLDMLHREVVGMEVLLGLPCRWTTTSQEYIDTVAYLSTREFQMALDNLERLVVQRIFELSRLNISGTGYKLREHMSKALKTRCRAIKNAVDRYNLAAIASVPPRPTVDFDKVSHYDFLEEFTLLRLCRDDITDRPWVLPVYRFTMRQARRIKQAESEIIRCNVEIRRLHSHLVEESRVLREKDAQLTGESSPLAAVFHDFALFRQRTNFDLLRRVHQTFQLRYTGSKDVGKRLAFMDSTSNTGAPHKADTDHPMGCPGSSMGHIINPEPEQQDQDVMGNAYEGGAVMDSDEEDSDDYEDEASAQVSAMIDYIGDLSVL